MKKKLSASIIDKEPWLLWNELNEVLSMGVYQELDLLMKPLSLAYWYDSELQNGGHLQYFENQGVENSTEVVQALDLIGAVEHEVIYKQALELWLSKTRDPIIQVDEYVEDALAGEFEGLDMKYYQCRPEITKLLEKYLEEHKNELFDIS